MCMDETKLNSDDSFFTEDHVVFLLNKYRALVLKKEKEKTNRVLDKSNSQTICLELEKYTDSEDPCGDTILRSTAKLPKMLDDDKATVYPYPAVGYFVSDKIIFTSMERIRYTMYNRWTNNLLYAAKGPDSYLYIKSANPQFLYLENVVMEAVFEDMEEAAELSCNKEEKSCDIMDSEFPLESALVPTVIELVVKELTGYKYQPRDIRNNAADDASLPQQAVNNSSKDQQAD